MTTASELVMAITKLIETSPVAVPITLMNHGVEQAAEVIGAVVEKCFRDGIKLDQVCLDPELGLELGLVEGSAFPHGSHPIVRLKPGLGRQLLFKRV